MKKKFWGFVSSTSIPVLCHSAGMETSDQSILSFLETGNYVELSYAEMYAYVAGKVQNQSELQKIGISNFSTGNLVNDYHFANAAAKLQISPQLSFGLIYDQPYGVDVDYEYKPLSYLGQQRIEATQLNFESENLTILMGYQPSSRWNIYAGGVYQQLQGHIDLYGANYSILSGYQAKFKQSSGNGWLAGLSYQIPEYALKTALTYRSTITHKSTVTETVSDKAINVVPFAKTEITTPQSVNLDVQIGLTKKNILYSSLRWVNWKDFEIQPRQFGAIVDLAVQQYPQYIKPFNMIAYKNDQVSAKLGLAHILSEQWLTTADFSWDSGSGNPASTLNPSDGYYAFGLGTLYKFHKNSFIAYGLKYFKLNKAEVRNININNPVTQNSTLSAVADNHALGHGIKIAYRF